MPDVRAIALLVVSCLGLLGVAPAAGAGEPRGDGGGLGRVVGFFSLGAGLPRDVSAAIDDWEGERPAAVLAALARAADDPAAARHRDEVFLLRGLVLDDLDWRDQAASAYLGVLGATPTSPYYPLALLRLVEGRRALGERDALIDAYRRHFVAPWQAEGARADAIRNFLAAYGDLRPPGPEVTSAEREILASPTELSALARGEKERPSERIAYLAGLELGAAGELREAVDAFERIGLTSPYYRYALFSAAQALFAMDDLEAARRKLRRLRLLPARLDAETALGERAGLLEAQILFAAGNRDGALRVAATAGTGPFGYAAQLLRGEICLESGSPSLAVAYLRDLEETTRDEDLDARRALGLGEAYHALGDPSAASAVLRAASSRLGASRATFEGRGVDAEIGSLRAEAESAVAAALERERERRQRIARGIRRVASFKGPMNLGKVFRVLFTSHANTILGAPVYDTSLIGEFDRAPAYRPKRPDGLWRTYLASAERAGVETSLRRLFALEGREGAWLAVDTALDDPAERSAWRERRITGAERRADESPPSGTEARARARLEQAVNGGLRRVVRQHAESLRRLQYEVDVALSQALRPTR